MNQTEKIAAIVGITEAIKQYGIPSKYCPTIAILVGALFGYAENPTSDGIIQGVILGATVTGGYSLVKRSGRSMLNNPADSSSLLEHDDYRGI